MANTEFQIFVGQNIKNCRLERGLTQEEVVEQVGISLTFYANIECGNRSMSLSVLRKLATVLNVSTDYILFGSSKQSRLQNIEILLRDQPDSFIILIEKTIQFYLENGIN